MQKPGSIRRSGFLIGLALVSLLITRCGEFNASGGILAPLALSLLTGTGPAPGGGGSTAGITITRANDPTTVTEGGSGDSYTIVLNTAPSSDVTLTVEPDAQLLANSSSSAIELLFTTGNWNTAQTVTVAAVDDSTVEGDHYGALTHRITTTDPDYSALTLSDLAVVIIDNDGDLPPSVQSITPADGATGVGKNTSITIDFSEAMNTATVDTNTTGTTCSGSIQVSSDNFASCYQMSAAPVSSNGNKTFTVSPNGGVFADNTTYKIRVLASIADSSGTAMGSNYTTTTGFTTTNVSDTTSPSVVSTLPSSTGGEAVQNTVILVEFNEAMSFSTLSTITSGSSCTGSIQVSSDDFATCIPMTGQPESSNNGKIATLSPASNLPASTNYKIKVTTDAQDLSGNSANAYTSASFTVGSTVDTTAPTASFDPTDGSVAVARTKRPIISFDDDMNPTTLTTNTGSNTSCSGTMQLSLDNFANCIPMASATTVLTAYDTFRMDPASNLTPGTTYKLRVITSISDKANNGLISQTVSFTTAPLRVFESGSATQGNFADGGAYSGNPVGFADNACNTSANRPDTSLTYKALFVNGTTGANDRTTTHNWILENSTTYYRTDQSSGSPLGTAVFTTGASGTFATPTTAILASGNRYWTGLVGSSWAVDTANQCDNSGAWKNNAGGGNKGAAGVGSATDNTAIGQATGQTKCDSSFGFLCVEQK